MPEYCARSLVAGYRARTDCPGFTTTPCREYKQGRLRKGRQVSELILVRHGQANSHAKNEAEYDRLSNLGRQQAVWLGEYLSGTDLHFDRVLTGTLSRQIETSRGMQQQTNIRDARLDELRYFDLTHAVERQYGIPVPDTVQDYARYLPEVISRWSRGHVEGAPESYEDFAGRTRSLLNELCAQGGRSLLVTSGGVISMMLTHVLDLTPAATAKLMLQVLNTSVHTVRFLHGSLMLSGFNATPHLDSPVRAHARTYI